MCRRVVFRPAHRRNGTVSLALDGGGGVDTRAPIAAEIARDEPNVEAHAPLESSL
jgi:hypothetical protein